MSDPVTPDGFQVRVDFERILETIAARIYDNQFAFLRENVQNAIDAVRIQARRDAKISSDSAYRVDIEIAGNEAVISDNGIGMTRADLVNNFWTMGASGKNTPEARAAGCIGTFGIGGFANFGVCETLEVTSRTESCATAHTTSLSRSAFGVSQFSLPTVHYAESEARKERGTSVRGISQQPFDGSGLRHYIKEFVSHVQEAVFFNGEKVSQVPFETAGKKRPLEVTRPADGGVGYVLYADSDTSLSAELTGVLDGGAEIKCSGYVRLLGNGLDVFKRGFRLCAVNVTSHIGVSGWLDSDALKPTAGRDTLDSASSALLVRIFQAIETSAIKHILADPDLLAGHIRLIPEFVRRGLLPQLVNLRVALVGDEEATLGDIKTGASPSRRVYYTSSGKTNSASEVLAARGHYIVKVSGNAQRRRAEILFLTKFCAAQEIDGVLECVEVYTNLDSFERSVLTELSLSIRKLFKPPEFKLIPGKMTLDTPIYWSGKREGAAVIVYVDTRHGELQKLKQLGYSSLFWSMMEAFCREYLTETLRRAAPKLFGAGAMDLDALSKANSELWELVIGDIEVSRLGSDPALRPGGRSEVMRRGDVTRVTISNGGVVADTGVAGGPDAARKAPKILQIVDESGRTGLSGYYLRIPESATAAFGSIIRSFSSFAVVWYANRLTWQGSDQETTAFLFDVTLDRLVKGRDGDDAHGAQELTALQLQTYNDQIYFYIPSPIEAYVVPRDVADLIRIQIRHELVDLNRARAWTSKEPKS